jgi:hypothetical protein
MYLLLQYVTPPVVPIVRNSPYACNKTSHPHPHVATPGPVYLQQVLIQQTPDVLVQEHQCDRRP